MDYMLEIKAFYDYIESNPQMTETCICLWHALMYQANKTGWKREFSVAISTLKLRTSLSKDAIYRARNKLKQFGLIEFKERAGNQSAVYILNSLLVSFIQTQGATQPATQTTPQDATHTANITKQDNTKQNNILSSEPNSDGEKAVDKLELDGDDMYERIYKNYPKKAGKADGKRYFIEFVTGGHEIKGTGKFRLNHLQIYFAVAEYSDKVEGKDEQYIKQIDGFLNKVILDYLDKSEEEYKKYMLKKYGEEWHKIKFKYKFSAIKPKKQRASAKKAGVL